MLRLLETHHKNMTNVACFMVNISHAQRVFKIPLVLLAFAIILKRGNTLKESKDKRKSRYDLMSPEGKAILTSNQFKSC